MPLLQSLATQVHLKSAYKTRTYPLKTGIDQSTILSHSQQMFSALDTQILDTLMHHASSGHSPLTIYIDTNRYSYYFGP